MPGIHAGVAHDRHGADCSMFMYKELMLTVNGRKHGLFRYFVDPECCWINIFSFVWMLSGGIQPVISMCGDTCSPLVEIFQVFP